jgi:hypothetical protein
MSFWAWLRGDTAITPNDTVTVPPSVGPDYTPGDPDGFEFTEGETEGRAVPAIFTSPWSGWPAEWDTPNWNGQRLNCLVDTAWACLDLNASVLSTMLPYKLRAGRVVEPEGWMTNPDPRVYGSWNEFAKELFWDYQLGEAFVLATDYFSNGYPMFMRIVPPCMVKVEVHGATRRYWLGTTEITADVLCIPYKRSLTAERGTGPLDNAGARLTAAGVLARYVADLVTSPPPYMTLETDLDLNAESAQDVLDQWVTSRATNRGHPAVLDSGIKLQTHQMNPKDMALLELAQFNESRIAVLLGVPPFLVGLPSGGDSMTYSNVSSLFDFHDRASLRPKATAVMSALSNWALPTGEAIELDRDEYSRPALNERAQAYSTLHAIDVLSSQEIRALERQLLASGNPIADDGATQPDQAESSRSLSVAEVVQKVYLGVVNGVITREEARKIINDAGGDLSVTGGT